MIVAVGIMRVMEVPTHQIINVIAVRRAFVSAVRAMSMLATVPFAVMGGRAFVRVGAAHRESMFINVVVMHVTQMTIMQIVGVPVVAYSHVPARGTVRVTMGCVRCALSFLHISSFLTGMPNTLSALLVVWISVVLLTSSILVPAFAALTAETLIQQVPANEKDASRHDEHGFQCSF